MQEKRGPAREKGGREVLCIDELIKYVPMIEDNKNKNKTQKKREKMTVTYAYLGSVHTKGCVVSGGIGEITLYLNTP